MVFLIPPFLLIALVILVTSQVNHVMCGGSSMPKVLYGFIKLRTLVNNAEYWVSALRIINLFKCFLFLEFSSLYLQALKTCYYYSAVRVCIGAFNCPWVLRVKLLLQKHLVIFILMHAIHKWWPTCNTEENSSNKENILTTFQHWCSQYTRIACVCCVVKGILHESAHRVNGLCVCCVVKGILDESAQSEWFVCVLSISNLF